MFFMFFTINPQPKVKLIAKEFKLRVAFGLKKKIKSDSDIGWVVVGILETLLMQFLAFCSFKTELPKKSEG